MLRDAVATFGSVVMPRGAGQVVSSVNGAHGGGGARVTPQRRRERRGVLWNDARRGAAADADISLCLITTCNYIEVDAMTEIFATTAPRGSGVVRPLVTSEWTTI